MLTVVVINAIGTRDGMIGAVVPCESRRSGFVIVHATPTWTTPPWITPPHHHVVSTVTP